MLEQNRNDFGMESNTYYVNNTNNIVTNYRIIIKRLSKVSYDAKLIP